MLKRLLPAVLLLASPLLAQPAPAPVSDKIDVNVVLLDAIVTDSRGNQILGLGPDDFIVREKSVAQHVDAADYFTNRKLLSGREQDAAFPVERVHEARYIVFFFDKPNSNEVSRSIIQARHDLARFLDSSMAPDDRIAVVGHDVRLKVYTDFTSDKTQLRHALDEATSFSRGRMQASDGPGSGPSILRSVDLDRMMNRTGTVLEALQVLADSLRNIRARKDLVLFSAGIISPDEDVRGGMILNRSRYYAPATDALNRANVAIYAITLQTSEAPEYVHQNLASLAADTNGQYFRYHTSFTTPLRQIEKNSGGYYLISYRPQSRDGKGFQKVDVSLKNPEFRVKARAGYSYGE